MKSPRILITGGAGFVGSSLMRQFRADFPQSEIVIFDNLRRRGSESNVLAAKSLGIEFQHGDVRIASDLEDLSGNFDWMIEASAEPSVHAGLSSGARYVTGTNLEGTLNCLEFAKRRAGVMVFLSTSRVFSIAALRELPLVELENRLELNQELSGKGFSREGIAEAFPTTGPRSLYGTTKLASELLVEEYAGSFGLKAFINRCGVLCGPGQFGTVEQGVFALWVASCLLGQPLTYRGFGGKGKQVRDILHPSDLYQLIRLQLEKPEMGNAEVMNVGGGQENSVSLREYTDLCEKAVGRKMTIDEVSETSPVDIPYYVTDNRLVTEKFGWRPCISKSAIVSDILDWLKDERTDVRALFAKSRPK